MAENSAILLYRYSPRMQGQFAQTSCVFDCGRTGCYTSPNFLALKYRNAWTAGLLLLVLMAVYVRLRMLAMPLERDEGEFAYMGQLMLQGIPPYQLAFNIKMPGIYAAYALIMRLFGENAAGIHLGFLFVNLGNLALLYCIARRWMNEVGALISCAAFVLLSLSPKVLGLQGHATNLVVLAALAGLLLLFRAREKDSRGMILLSGILFGLSFLCKQPGLFFGLFALAVLARDAWVAGAAQWRLSAANICLFALGLAVPLALTCIDLWWAGTFPRFWFWTVKYAQAHSSVMPPSYVLHRLAGAGSEGWERWLFLLGFAGWLWTLFHKGQDKFLITAFFFSSICALLIGRYLAQHYFVVMLPVISILIGMAVSGWAEQLAHTRWPWFRAVPVALFLIICAGIIRWNARFWFLEPPEVACADIYFACPFVECLRVGEFIRDHSAPKDRLAVIGSEPEIYFYSQRHSVSGYIYMYDLVEPQPYAHDMQREFIHDVEAARPEYLVLVNTGTSWMTWADADPQLFKWISGYPKNSYDLIGVVEMYPDHSEYRWGKEAASEKPKTYNAIFTWKRK
jgi:hypothetical protein